MPERLRVLVTRPAGQAQGLCEQLEAHGFTAIGIPSLEIEPLDDPAAIAAAAELLDTIDLAIFVSVNAVQSGLAEILAIRAWPAGTRLATVGPASRAAVEALGLSVDLAPEHDFSSEGLLALDALRDMHGRRVAIFRGSGGRNTLYDTLQARGAEVEYIQIYHRRCPAESGELQRLLGRNGIDVVTATSNEALQNLYDMAGASGQPQLRQLPLVIPGSRQAELAARLGFLQGAVIAGHAGDAAMLEGVRQLAGIT